jgi:Ca2+/Na+ antiporter
LFVAGTVLTKCADTIAELTKLGRLLVGSVLLAGSDFPARIDRGYLGHSSGSARFGDRRFTRQQFGKLADSGGVGSDAAFQGAHAVAKSSRACIVGQHECRSDRTRGIIAHAAEQFAQATGLGRTFVGTTLVALSTSLPEFVASLAAIRMKAFDLAIGNVFGSNSFNMLLMVPLDIVHPGALMASVAAGHGITCLAAILATQTAIMGQLYNVEGRWRFIDPDAWLVIAIVLGGLALVYYTQ